MTAEVGTGGIILVINTRVGCAGEAAISSAILAALLLDTVHLVNPLAVQLSLLAGAGRCGAGCLAVSFTLGATFGCFTTLGTLCTWLSSALWAHVKRKQLSSGGRERGESEILLVFFFFVFDFAYDALATCLLDDVHSLNNREKQRSGTKCTQWELCRHTTNDTLCQLSRSLALPLPHDVCVVCALSLSLSLASQTCQTGLR